MPAGAQEGTGSSITLVFDSDGATESTGFVAAASCEPVQRTCADISMDRAATDDPFDCSTHALDLDASITCATDPCTATECCRVATGNPCGSGNGIASTDTAVTWDSHDGDYTGNQICVWTMSCTDSTLVPTVTFRMFDTEDDDDFVYAFDGTCDYAGFSPGSTPNCGSGGPSLMGTASGTAVPAGAQRGTGSSVRTQQQRNQRDGMQAE